MSTWSALIANAIVALLGAGGVSWFLAKSQRRKYDAESSDLRTGVMEKVDKQTDRALERADRCLQRLDQLEAHIDRLEGILRENGLAVPPVPTPLPWPRTHREF